MSLLYNFFTGTANVGDVAWTISNAFFKKFGIIGDVTNFYNSLTWKLRAISNSFGGNFSWADLGGVIIDLGEFIFSVTPGGKVVDIVSFLWTCANAL